MPRYSTCDYRYNLAEEDPCLAAKARFNRTPFCGNTWYKFLCIVCSILLFVMLIFVVIGVIATSWASEEKQPGIASSVSNVVEWNLNDSSSTEPLHVPMELTSPPIETPTTEWTTPSTSTESTTLSVRSAYVKVEPVYRPKISPTTTSTTTEATTTTTTEPTTTTTTTQATTTTKVVPAPVEKVIVSQDISLQVEPVFHPNQQIHRSGITMIIPVAVTPPSYAPTIQSVAHGSNVRVDTVYQARTTISGETTKIMPAPVTAAPLAPTIQSANRGVQRYREWCRNPKLRKGTYLNFCDQFTAKP